MERYRQAGIALENQNTPDSAVVVDGFDSEGNLMKAVSTPNVEVPARRTPKPEGNGDVLPPSHVQALLSLNINFVATIRLCLKRGDPKAQFQGARAIREAARDHPECREAMGAAGAARALLRLLKETNPELVLEALQALVNLTCECPENRVLIPTASMDALQLIIDQLDGETEEIQEKAAELIFGLSLDNSNKLELNHSGATATLIRLMSRAPAIRRIACKALYNISLAASCRFSIIEADAIPALMRLARQNSTDEEKRVAEKALLVLKMLCSVKAGWEQIGAYPGWVAVFLSGVESGSVVGQEAALHVLAELAGRSKERRELILLEDPLPVIWKLTQSKEKRVFKKALELQRLLTIARSKQ